MPSRPTNRNNLPVATRILTDWFYRFKGQTCGPVKYTDFINLAARGIITPETQVSHDTSMFYPALNFSELAFSNVPVSQDMLLSTAKKYGYKERLSTTSVANSSGRRRSRNLSDRTPVQAMFEDGPWWVKLLMLVALAGLICVLGPIVNGIRSPSEMRQIEDRRQIDNYKKALKEYDQGR